MDTLGIPLEHLKADEKRQKQDAQAIAKYGHGATTGNMAITRQYVKPLAEALEARLILALETKSKAETIYNFLVSLKSLPMDLVALCCLQSALQGVAVGEPYRDSSLKLGLNISAEMWAAKLTQHNPDLARQVEAYVRKAHSRVKERRQAARSIAARAGFKLKHWTPTERLNAGNWLLDETVMALPLIFEKVEDSEGAVFLTVTDGAIELAQAAMREAMVLHPVMQPVTEPLPAWTDFHMAPLKHHRDAFGVTFVRAIHRETQAAVKAAIRSGQMKPALDAVNTLQSVAWKINTRVLDVMRECTERKIDVPGLPPARDLAKPTLPQDWDQLDDKAKAFWKWRVGEVKKRNRAFNADRLLLTEDMTTVERLESEDRFYTPMNCDWRGRVYGLCHFNFQREDRVRALFEFADGEPIGEEGLWWLKVHVANCGDFDKISKRPLQERVEWCDRHIARIQETAANPIASTDWWTKADQPFLFLASVLELSAAVGAGPRFVTTLPVSFDGSCSGLQHLCAMTRAAEGSLVNLTPQEKPQDVYQTVADIVRARVEADTENPLAQAWLAHGIDRKVVKRNVMTYSYSSKKFGMAAQQEEDLITPLGHKVVTGELAEHPFTAWAEKPHRDAPSPAASYIAKHTYAGIETVVEKPALAMTFLQKLAKALAHEGKPVRWTTPTGIPWSNRYHVPIISRVTMWMHDKGVKRRHDMHLGTGFEKEIDKARSSNGIAPNFVHALDAAHLMLTVNAAASEGVTALATVHDSFGCLASRAGRFNQIIRAEFVRMYETHDVLTEVFEQSKCDLTQANWHRLPDQVAKGPLNIQEVLNADYCFA